MELLKRLQNRKWTVPVLLLILTILAYGLLIPTLGFYFDDWPVVYMIQSGANFWDFYQYDRPFSAWTYVLTAPILGTSPFLWHTFTLLLRWLTSLLLWWILTRIWPKNTRESTWVAMLFAVHPVFQQQSIAVAYSQHFITYALFFLSCGTMITAIQKPGRNWHLVGISITSAILHIFTMEYFWGLEMVRPILLWIAFSNQSLTRKEKTKKTFLNWLPYFAALLGALVWRVGFYSQRFAAGEDPNSLRLLSKLQMAPLQEGLHLIEMAARDLVYLMVSVWSCTIQPDLVEISPSFVGLSWILVVLSFFLLWNFRTKFYPPHDNDLSQPGPTWIRQAIMLGFAIFILGTLPVWITDKYIHNGMYADRFALPGMWGASLLVVAVLSAIEIPHKPRSFILSIMICLAIGTHFRISNDYRWDWVNQRRFFWQLHWRAPALEPGTAIFSEGSLFSFLGEYPTAFAINTFYDLKTNSTELPYWFIELDSGFHSNPSSYLNGINLSKSLRNYSFKGKSRDSIMLHYNPEDGNCLWVLDEHDRVNMELPGLTWDALPLSDLSRIQWDQASSQLPSRSIFGKEPEHNWCFYYQKADLAQQKGDWRGILQIKDTTDELGFEPNNKLEWIPFIDAFAELGKWREAAELTLSAYESAPITRKTFCSLWASFPASNLEVKIEQKIISDVIDSLGCQ